MKTYIQHVGLHNVQGLPDHMLDLPCDVAAAADDDDDDDIQSVQLFQRKTSTSHDRYVVVEPLQG